MESPADKKAEYSSEEEVLRRFSYAEKFRQRKRPGFWLYLAPNGLLLLAFAAFLLVHGGISFPWWSYPLLFGMVILGFQPAGGTR